MMKVKSVVLTSALAGVLSGGLVGLVSGAQAQEKQVRSESPQQAEQRISKERQVSGTVLDTKTIKFRGSDQQNTVALIRTNRNNRRLVVDLGPKKSVKELNVKKGQQLSAKGVVVNLGDEQLLVASEVKRGNKSVEIDRMPQIEGLRKQQGQQQGTQQRQQQPGMRGPQQQPGMQGPQQQPGTQRQEQEMQRQQQRMEEQQQDMQNRQQKLQRREQQMEKELEQEREQMTE